MGGVDLRSRRFHRDPHFGTVPLSGEQVVLGLLGGGPIRAVALQAKRRSETQFRGVQAVCKLDGPVKHKAVVRSPQVADFHLPNSIQRTAIKVAPRLDTFVGARRERALSVLGPCAIGGVWGPVVIESNARGVGIAVVVHWHTKKRSPSTLLVDHHALAVGTLERDGQVSHETVLEVDEKVLDGVCRRQDGLTGDELGEGQLA